MYIVHYTMYILQCIMYVTKHNVNNPIYNLSSKVQCTVYMYIVYNMYIVHSVLYVYIVQCAIFQILTWHHTDISVVSSV